MAEVSKAPYSKAQEAAQDALPRDEPAPAYEEVGSSSSSYPPQPQTGDALSVPDASSSSSPLAARSISASSSSRNLAPTITSPFNFPVTDGPPPDYATAAATFHHTNPYSAAGPSSSSAGAQQQQQRLRPILFPQVSPGEKSPFLVAYSQTLLAHGVTEATWRSFLDTISAFLTAKVSDRALSHAADMAAHVSKAPTRFGKNVANHAKNIGANIAGHAKRGNVFGVAGSVIGGAISLPIATAMGAVGTALSLPGTALGAAVKKPRTPLERAAAYAAVANDKWFHPRGLHAQLFDTRDVAQLLDLAPEQILETVRATKESLAAPQLRSLEPYVAELEVQEGATLTLERGTLWLVIIPWGTQ